ncbi:hypothetical protein [Kitasatospora sp. NPDC059599]|uniref:hypothetical protein n=1 Tax=Kitasatospora sp. NPDC059599 TaxID=3346880 RepID=UPI0036CAF430
MRCGGAGSARCLAEGFDDGGPQQRGAALGAPGLDRAHLLGWTTDARTDEHLADCPAPVADVGADLLDLPLDLPPATLRPGTPADLMVVTGACLPQVVIDLPPRELVGRAGRVVARDGRFTGGPGPTRADPPGGTVARTRRTGPPDGPSGRWGR